MKPFVYYNEIDPFAVQWLRNLIVAGLVADGVVDDRDIRDVRPGDVRGFDQCHFFAGIGGWSHALRLAGWGDGRRVWTGSCPCQPFSAAGKRSGFDDERHLWPAFHHLIRVCRPSVVFGEQVASKDGLAWLDLVQADLEGEGYAVGSADLCAAGVGAPHIRQRLYWVANAHSERRIGQRLLLQQEAAGWEPTNLPEIAGSGPTDRLVHSDGRDSRPEGLQRRWQHGQQPESGGTDGRLGNSAAGGLGIDGSPSGESGHAAQPDAVDGMDDTAGPRQPPEERRQSAQPEGGGRLSSMGRPWDDLEWIACTDGKARPTKSGIFPLVDGPSFKLGSGQPQEGLSRVGILRGAGNAIVPQVAAEFIGAYMECRP